MERPTYTAAQLHAYYERISLPRPWRLEPGKDSRTAAQDPRRGLKFLTALQQSQLVSVPFENLSFHYSTQRTVSIDPLDIYEKIIGRGQGRGGHCMEANGLFGTVLRSLGFDVYPVCGRVNASASSSEIGRHPQFRGWNHMLHIVTFGTTRYVVDVGFGFPEMTRPLALDQSSTTPVTIVASQLGRLRRDFIPHTIRQSGSEQLLWIYETRNALADDNLWIPSYCFTELEFLPADFKMMNFFVCNSLDLFFHTDVICFRYLSEDDEIVGSAHLSNQRLRIYKRGTKLVDTILQTECDRVRALAKHFNVDFTDEEQTAIESHRTEIR
ncbi:MAG: hypothetical protein Q9159_004222 [Coniocarpon cinnabarinum]